MKYLPIFLLFVWASYAQEPLYFNLGEDKGLPDKTIYDIVEDKNHFIWLATESGIYKYDGNDFVSYSNPKQIGLSVFNLTLDDSNVLWFNNLSNQLLCIRNGSKTEIFLELNDYFKGENTKISTTKDYVFVTGRDKIVIVDKSTKKIAKSLNLNLSNSNNKPLEKKGFVYMLNKNNIWFSIDLSTLKINELNITTKVPKQDNKTAFIFMFDHLTDFYILSSTKTEKFAYHYKDLLGSRLDVDGAFTNKRIINSTIIDNQLWVSAEDGLYIYDIKEKILQLQYYLFKDKLVTKVIKDVLGNYWVATHDNGIYVIPNIHFKTLKNFQSKSNIKYQYNGFTNFYIQDNNNYVFQYNVIKSKFKKLPNYGKKEDIKYIFENPYSREVNIQSIVKGAITLSEDLKFVSKKTVSSVFKDINYISLDTYLNSSNIYAGIFKNDFNKTSFGSVIYVDKVRSYSNVYDKKSKAAYFANINGFFTVDSLYQKKEILHNGSKIFAKKVIQSKNGTIWVLCFKDKILKILDNKVVDELNTNNGLLDKINTDIYSYKNTLWLLGNSGIQTYNMDTKKFVNITKKDGLPSYDFKGIFIANDNVYISTSEQILSFNINSFKKEAILLNPYITKIEANGTEVNKQESSSLPSETEKLTIFFNTNGLFSKETISYKYKLNNSNWETVNRGSNVISFNRISSGEYNLQIVASYQGLTSKAIQYNFSIKTPIYKTWPFIILSFVSVFIIILFVLNKKSKRIQQQQDIKLQQQNQELENINLKLENLRSQMNPHFIFNALNSIQDYILRNETTLARHFLVKFSRLIRMYLEHTQRDSLVLNEEIEALTLYLDLEKDRFSKDFNYSINLCENTNPSQINLPPFLIQPYVENAIKHGLMHKKGAKNLTLNLSKTDKNIFICEIIDDGIGFQKSQEINQKQSSHKSFSTGANNKRIELLNKTRSSEITLQIVNLEKEGTTSGTKIVLKIPQ